MRALVDAGPLVAILNPRDPHHARCVAALRKLRQPLVTVWPVLTEAMHFLGDSVAAVDALWAMLERDVLRLANLDATDAPRMRALMAKYADLPMDLADAALVRVAERESIHTVFTVDRRDFSVYRARGNRKFAMLPLSLIHI